MTRSPTTCSPSAPDLFQPLNNNFSFPSSASYPAEESTDASLLRRIWDSVCSAPLLALLDASSIISAQHATPPPSRLTHIPKHPRAQDRRANIDISMPPSRWSQPEYIQRSTRQSSISALTPTSAPSVSPTAKSDDTAKQSAKQSASSPATTTTSPTTTTTASTIPAATTATTTTSRHTPHTSFTMSPKTQESSYHLYANPKAMDTTAREADLSANYWVQPIDIDDEDLTFGGKSLSTWYEEERRRLSSGSSDDGHGSDEREERRGRERVRRHHGTSTKAHRK